MLYKLLETILNRIDRIIHDVSGFCMFVATIWMFICVVLRYLFRVNFYWAEESIRYLMLVSAYWLGGYTMVNNKMVALTVVTDLIKSPKAHRVLDMFYMVLTIIVSALMTFWTFRIFLNVKGQVTASMFFPKQLPYFILLVGMAVMCISCILKLIMLIIEPNNKEEGGIR